MRASVERRRAEQARRKEIEGIIGAGLAGLALALPFALYIIIY